jgi:transposase InsO family protein
MLPRHYEVEQKSHLVFVLCKIQFRTTVPYVPRSHSFVERLIGTVRREYLDRTLFWTTVDLERKLIDFQHYYNRHRTHAGLEGRLPEPSMDGSPSPIPFDSYTWRSHCRGLYQTAIAA